MSDTERMVMALLDGLAITIKNQPRTGDPIGDVASAIQRQRSQLLDIIEKRDNA